jgi:hypothetical protein
MAVVFDTATSNVTGGDTGAALSSATLAFTGASGASLAVFVGYSRNQDVVTGTAALAYNSVAMTQQAVLTPGSNTARAFLFTLLNCCDGAAHNIVVTTGGQQPAQIILGAVSATGVGAFTGATSLAPGIVGNTGNMAVTSTGTDDLVVAGANHGDVISGVGTGTQRWIQNPTSVSAGGDGIGSTVPGAAGTVNVAYTSSLSDHWAMVAVNFQAAVAAPAPGLLLSMAGDGLRAMDGSRLVPMAGPSAGRPSAARRIRSATPPPPTRGVYPR